MAFHINTLRRQFFTVIAGCLPRVFPVPNTIPRFMMGSGINYDAELGLGDILNRDMPVTLPSSYVDLSCMGYGAMGLKADGSLWAWGSGRWYRSGTGSLTTELNPVQILIGPTWTSMSSSYSSGYAINSLGELWSWGSNSWGERGIGHTADEPLTTRVGTDTDWLSVSSGDVCVMALKTDGTIWACGDNYYGQCGRDPNEVPYYYEITEFRQINLDTDWVQIIANSSTFYAFKSNGTLWGWGYPDVGGLNFWPTEQAYWIPIEIGGGCWSSISAKGDHILLLGVDGSLWSMGRNYERQLGRIGDWLLLQIGTDTDWVEAEAAYGASVALKSNGEVYVWGMNYNYNRIPIDYRDYMIPLPALTGTSNATKLLKGSTETFLLTDSIATAFVQTVREFKLYTWGANDRGQLGNSTTIDVLSPTQIGTDSWLHITAQSKTSAGIKKDGTLWVWGANDNYILGLNDLTDRHTPTQIAGTWKKVSIGLNFMVAIKADGTLWAWGSNSRGQLGNGTTTASQVPIQIGVLSFVDIACGGEHVIAAPVGTGIYTWGRGDRGQIGNGGVIDQLTPYFYNLSNGYDSIGASRYCSYANPILNSRIYRCGGADNFMHLKNDAIDLLSFSSYFTGTSNAMASYGLDTIFLGDGYGLDAFGKNEVYQLGIGNNTSPVFEGKLRPEFDYFREGGGAGERHCYLIHTQNKSYSSGENVNGQLGSGNTVNQTVLTSADQLRWEMISCGEAHNLGIK